MGRTRPTKDERQEQRESSIVAELLDDPEHALTLPERAPIAVRDTGKGVYYCSEGRPSKYDQDPAYYCERVVEVMATGVTQVELCLELKIHPSTLTNWIKKNPDFADAVAAGEVLCEAWWLSQGRTNLKNTMFNNRLYSMHMCNRFNWTQRKDVRGAIAHLGNFQHHHTADEAPEQIEATEDVTAQVLDILIGAGAIESAAMQPADPEDDEVHSAQADA